MYFFLCIIVFSWLSDLFPGLKVNVMSSNVRTTAIDTLCLCDVEVQYMYNHASTLDYHACLYICL